jgi:capsular exopolysaccharide synthesis family protein
MSKIFEALRKTEGETAEIAMSVVGSEKEADTKTTPEPVLESAPPSDCSPADCSPAEEQQAILTPATQSVPSQPGSPVLPFNWGGERAAEQYRIVRNKILHHPQRPRVLLVTSPMPGDGKTINALNLAGALALQQGARVLLIDCDFRRSSLSRLLGIRVTPGLGEVLRGEAAMGASLIRIEQSPNLYVMPPGNASPNPSELLSTPNWQVVQECCRREFAFVVLDAPPVGTVADYQLLELASDGVVLVVRPDHTNRQLWAKAVATVPAEKQLGVVLNCVENWFLWKTHSYYYYLGDAK